LYFAVTHTKEPQISIIESQIANDLILNQKTVLYHMKHIIQYVLLLAFLSSSAVLPAQSSLKKANKEYELYAFNLAIKSYRKVLAKDENNLEAMARMADCYRHLNQSDDAIQWYKRVVDQSGVDPIHIFNYARALQNKGEYEEAKKWFLLYAEGQPMFGNHYADNCDFAISMRGVPALYRVKNEYVNTSAADFGAAFFLDQVIYSSTRTDIKRQDNNHSTADWTGGRSNQLFSSSRDDNSFLKPPTLLRSDIRNEYNEGPLSYTSDGSTVAYTKNNFVEGTRQIPSSGIELSIYIAEVAGNGDWQNAKPFDFNGSGYSSGYPAFANNGKTMYFASNRPDGYGGYDIYVTQKIGTTWSTPENLGPAINSPGNEISPHFDGQSLFFSSDWHQGLGGLDIFRAEKTEGQFGKLYHLGNGVNSPRDDYNFVFDLKENIGYFTSNRLGGKGKEDIYQVSRSTDRVKINVVDALRKTPIEGASIDFSSCGEPVFKADVNGFYSFQALAGFDCEVIVSKEGYSPYSFKVSSAGQKKTQDYEVLLTRKVDQLIGKVIDASNNASVEGVYIKATDQADGRSIETRTDASGSYSLALQPGTNYIIRYSKAGFLETHNRLETSENIDKSILGVILFEPSSTFVTSSTMIPDDKVKEDVVKEEKLPVEAEAADPITTQPAATEPQIEEGYSVQIAAMSGEKKVDLDKYNDLKSVGNFYSRAEKGYKKLRVGIFASKEEAKEALSALREKGYKKAFIVSENLDETDGVQFYEAPMARIETPAPKVEKKTTAEIKEVIESSSSYKVRLAAYKNPKYFDQSKVTAYGQVEQRSKGEFTIMLLGGFASLEDAISARSKVVNSGFKGAYVVLEEDGRLVKINL